ncbi:MAG TPA: hypothetical protein VKA02_00205 [Candidatus Acidoferrum sp.]|nr:hypothetical protein [Candidatus Acidoferrum sp.]
MRTKIAQAVRAVFARKLQQEIGQFAPVETRRIRAGDRLFGWQMAPDMNAYIYLFISPKYNQDRFAIELACSAGEFPMQMAREPSHTERGAVRFRLPQLYKDQWPKRNWEPMWEVGPHENPREAIARAVSQIKVGELTGRKDEGLLPLEQAMQFVEPQTQDAIDKIRTFGIPFFREFAIQNSRKT